jgi:dihydroflavonol-4-reductase
VKPALVTGATGFVGWHVARLLVERGVPVRALVRPSSRLRELDVELVPGDLRNPESLKRAVAGCGLVFHVAADYRLWAPDSEEMYRSNVGGTRSLLGASRAAGVERVVYTSTVGCIGVPAKGLGHEDRPVSLDQMTGSYKRSKFLAERAALQFAAEGFPVVIVNPTAPIGDHDFKPTPTGKIIVDYLKGAMPAFLDTGLNLVDVRDVAEGHLLACEKGRPGQRYILGCSNMTLQQIFQELEKVSGIPAPTRKIPYAVALVAGIASTGWARLSGREPRVPPTASAWPGRRCG